MTRQEQEIVDRIKVLYIGAWGRSGSTILDSILGQVNGFFSAGELHRLWEPGLLENRRCGCGRIISHCPVWARVIASLAKSEGDAQIRELTRWAETSLRVRDTWGLLRREGHRLSQPMEAYVRLLSRLYHEIGKVSGSSVVVDSSKRPSRAAALRLAPDLDVYFIHLVRDPRAVAYSWGRSKTEPDHVERKTMKQHGPFNSTLRWLWWNLAAEAVSKRVGTSRSLHLRYEDFVRDPQALIDRVRRMIGDGAPTPKVAEGREVHLGGNHIVMGNPARFTSGEVELHEDKEWVSGQSRADRFVSTLISLPLLRRYSYPLIPR